MENSTVGINDAGDQARFLVNTGAENLVYPFRYHNGTWQQIGFAGTGHLSLAGVGSINDAQDITATVQSTGRSRPVRAVSCRASLLLFRRPMPGAPSLASDR